MKGIQLITPETLRQLDNDLWRAIRRLGKVRGKYFRKGKTERVEPQEEILNLFGYLNGKMKQMTVKMINQSRSDAIAIANDALTNRNPKKRQENMSRLLTYNRIFNDLQEDAGNEKRMSHILGNVAIGTRKQINPIITNVQNKLPQIGRMEQQAKKQPQRPGFWKRLRGKS